MNALSATRGMELQKAMSSLPDSYLVRTGLDSADAWNSVRQRAHQEQSDL